MSRFNRHKALGALLGTQSGKGNGREHVHGHDEPGPKQVLRVFRQAKPDGAAAVSHDQERQKKSGGGQQKRHGGGIHAFRIGPFSLALPKEGRLHTVGQKDHGKGHRNIEKAIDAVLPLGQRNGEQGSNQKVEQPC